MTTQIQQANHRNMQLKNCGKGSALGKPIGLIEW